MLIIFFFLIIAIAVTIKLFAERKTPTPLAAKQPPAYTYGRKSFIMTYSENEFFQILKDVLQDRYQIFPQVHLTAFLNEKVKGQNWNAAFRHINAKSVDFVVCDIKYARPLLAIELDDPSHDDEARRLRDVEVERIFENAKLPLLRFNDYKNVSREAIAAQLENALRSQTQPNDSQTTETL